MGTAPAIKQNILELHNESDYIYLVGEGRTIEYHPVAVKALHRMDRVTADRIRAKLRQLADQPETLANNIARLKGNDKLWRLRVGDWRVIYTEDMVVLTILRIAARGSVYE